MECDLQAVRAEMHLGGHTARIEPWTTRLSEETREARNDAFRDHWGSQPMSADRWQALITDDEFAPDLSFIAVEYSCTGPRVVGFLIAMVHGADWAGQGFSSSYVHLVGTVRSHRGQGIARRLLLRHLQSAQDRGLDKATLDVDSENTGGAMPLYENVGFVATATQRAYVQTLEEPDRTVECA
jgi:ribosomal protein S18 acetylase RimI-like enzyme